MKKTKRKSIRDLVQVEHGRLGLKTPIVTHKDNSDAVFVEVIHETLADPELKKALLEAPDKEEKSKEFKAKLKIQIAKDESEVSDEVFFEHIAEEPILLGSLYAQQKIQRWRQELQSEDNGISFRAQDNLKGIGEALARKGRPQGISKALVAAVREDVLRRLKDVDLTDGEEYTRSTLEEIFGKEIAEWLPAIPATPGGVTNEIVARLTGLAPSTVEKYYGDVEKISFKSSSAFVEKPSRKTRQKK